MAKKPKVLTKDKYQIGKSDLATDKQLQAMPPGKRRSKTGKIYYEHRKNRTDLKEDSISTREVKVRKHTRNGETNVKSHTRTIESKKVDRQPPKSMFNNKPKTKEVKKTIPLKHIVWQWNEGKNIVLEGKKLKSWNELTNALGRVYANYVKSMKEVGEPRFVGESSLYDKVKLTILWEDGSELTDRVDVGYSSGDYHFQEEIGDYIKKFAGGDFAESSDKYQWRDKNPVDISKYYKLGDFRPKAKFKKGDMIERRSNGKIYKVIDVRLDTQTKKHNVLIDRGEVVGLVLEDENKFTLAQSKIEEKKPQGFVKLKQYKWVEDFLRREGFLTGNIGKYIKLQRSGYDDLVVEKIGKDEYSIAYYYRHPSGDSLREPEITFFVLPYEDKLTFVPLSYQLDSFSIYQNVEWEFGKPQDGKPTVIEVSGNKMALNGVHDNLKNYNNANMWDLSRYEVTRR
jgi:hypothetical protein